MVHYDFDQRDVLPPGEYRARCKSAKPKTVQDGKYPCLLLEWVVVEGKYAGLHLCFDRLIASPDAAWIARKKLGAIGFDVRGKGLDVEPEDLRDVEVYLTVEEREYKGNKSLQPSGNAESCFGYRSVDPAAPGAAPDEEAPPEEEVATDTPF